MPPRPPKKPPPISAPSRPAPSRPAKKPPPKRRAGAAGAPIGEPGWVIERCIGAGAPGAVVVGAGAE